MFAATVLTLFPAMFPGPLGQSLAGEALAKGLWSLEARDIREHGIGRHRAVDDTPAGGGPGMVMRADVLAASLDAAAPPDDPRPRLVMSPRGKPFAQAEARTWAAGPGLVILCPRFEGIDERIIEGRGLIEVSIGDYVLSGGEIAALAILDACVRLIPGVMGRDASSEEESFEKGLLEYPHYTRPREWGSRGIPDVLLSGDHAKIAEWRRAEAERITKARRPDLGVSSPARGRRRREASDEGRPNNSAPRLGNSPDNDQGSN
jgi:tRNA (guanine37-N1)-methyltransferase